MGIPSAKRPWWFKILRGLLVTAAVLSLLLALAAWWLLSTASGAKWLVSSALPYVQDSMPDTLQLHVEDIEATTLANLHIGNITLADRQGVWFEVEQLTLRWMPSALLQARVHVQELSVAQVHFIRSPIVKKQPPASFRTQIESLQTTFKELPDTLQGIRLPPLKADSVTISEFAIDGEWVNIPSRFHVEGKADFTSPLGQLDISLKSLEGIKTHASIVLENQTLHMQWHEAAGGLLGNVLQLQTPAAVNVTINAEMQNGSLHHTLSAQAGDLPLLNGTMEVPVSAESPLALTIALPNPSLSVPLTRFSQPLSLSATLGEENLTVDASTPQISINAEQSLADVSFTAHITFEDEPLFIVDSSAQAIWRQGEKADMPVQVLLAATGDVENWEISNLQANAPDMQIQAQGELDIENGAANLYGTTILPLLEAHFEVSADNLLDTPHAKANLVLEKWKRPLPSPLDSILKAPLTLTAKTQPSDAALPDVAIALKGDAINGHVTLYPSAQTLARVELSTSGLPIPLSLTADYRTTGEGHLEATSNALQLATDYAITNSVIKLNDLHLDAVRNMALAGNLTFNTQTTTATGALSGTIKSTAPFNNLGLQLPSIEASNGTLDIRFTAPSGTQNAAMSFESGRLSLDNAPVANNLSFKADVSQPKNGTLQLASSLEATALDYSLALDTFALTTKGDLNALDWHATAKHAATNSALDAAGKMQIADTIILAINHLTANWQENALALQHPAIFLYSSKEMTVQDITLVLNKDSKLTANASLRNNAVKGDIAITRLPLKALPVEGVRNAQGIINGTFNVAGNPANPAAEWIITIEDLQKNYPKLAKVREQPLTLSLHGGIQRQELTTQLSVNTPNVESFAAHVAMPMDISLIPDAWRFSPKGILTASIKADLRLTPFLPLFMPDNVYGSGHLVANLTAKGTLAHPILQGAVDLHSGRIEILQSGTLIDDITLKMIAKNSRIAITEGHATDGGKGQLRLGGSLELTPTLPMDLKTDFSDFVALRHPSASATVSGETTLAGDLSDALLRGDWAIATAKILIQKAADTVPELQVVEVSSLDEPLNLLEEVEEKSSQSKAGTRKQRRLERPFSRNLALDININAENQVFLDGFGLNAELKGAVDVSGTAARPKLDGKMETVRGRWEFFGRTFTITRGEAILSEQNLSTPLINIRAEAEADDILAIAQISGSTNSPKIEFSSIPPLPKDEILSRIMFGQKLKNISPYQALQLADMLRSLSGSGSGGSMNPLSKLQDTLGIDELKINNQSGNTEDVTVGVGKYVRENVYLEVEGGAGENSGKVSVEVDLTPRISVETETRQNADSALRLNYKYDY